MASNSSRTDGLREPLLLRSAVGRQDAGFGDEELYPTLPAKAGALFHGICSNHAFIDGNKRTAAYAAIMLVRRHGAELRASNDELVDLAVSTAAESRTVEDVIVWFDKYVS